jgi:hypothetical protein
MSSWCRRLHAPVPDWDAVVPLHHESPRVAELFDRRAGDSKPESVGGPHRDVLDQILVLHARDGRFDDGRRGEGPVRIRPTTVSPMQGDLGLGAGQRELAGVRLVEGHR